MILKVNFMYENEVYSFLNKIFTKFAIGFYILLAVVGYFTSDVKTTISVLLFLTLVYVLFFIKTMKIKKKYKYYKENGIRYDGIIKDIKVREGHTDLVNDMENRFETVRLIVEYKNPKTNKLEQIITESVNGNPYAYLSSLEVAVYVLEDGTTLVTDFKKIKRLSDSVRYKTNENYRKDVDNRYKFKFLIEYIILIALLVFAYIKTNLIITFMLLLIIIGIIIFRNRK